MASQFNRAKLEVEHSRAASSRLITGCTQSSPTNAVLREAGLLPLHVMANQQAAIQRETFLRLPEDNPSRSMMTVQVRRHRKAHGRGGEFKDTWRDIAESWSQEAGLSDLPREDLLPTSIFPTWTAWSNVQIFPDLDHSTHRSDPPDVRRMAALEILEALPPPEIQIWTDGSVESAIQNGGSGVVFTLEGRREKRHYAAGRVCSSFRAELMAIDHALELVNYQADLYTVENIMLCTDSRSALQTLSSGPTSLKEDIPLHIWDTFMTLAHSAHITLQWVPGHAGLSGNEQADSEANKGRYEDQADIPIDFQTSKGAINRLAKRKFNDFDLHTIHHRQASLGMPPSFTSLPRSDQVTLSQLT